MTRQPVPATPNPTFTRRAELLPGNGPAAAGRGCELSDNTKATAETPPNKTQALNTSEFHQFPFGMSGAYHPHES